MANPKATQMWFEKARMDLRVAKHLHPLEKDFYVGIVFHAQQCAEKSIKGFLTHHNVRVTKTHDMKHLLDSLGKIDATMATQYSELEIFTLYAVEYRYPDSDLHLPALTAETVAKAVQLAEALLNDLSQRIFEIKNS